MTGDPKWCKLVQLWDQLFVKDGILWRFFENLDGLDGVNQLVVPDSLKNEVLYGVHESIGGGHLGVEKTVVKLKERFYWPGHYSDVQNWCATCSSHVPCKTTQPHRRGGLQPSDGCCGEWKLLHFSGTRDYFIKWLEAWAIPNQEAKTIAQQLLNEMFLRFSLQDRLHSDQGHQFESNIMEELCRLLQIEKTRTTPYHPQGDGLVERANWTILSHRGRESSGLGVPFEGYLYGI